MTQYNLQYTGAEIDLRLQNVVIENIIRVAKGGDGDTASLQTAINQAGPNDLIRWFPGIFTENIVINGNVFIEGVGILGNNAILAPSSGNTITINSGTVLLSNLGITCPTNSDTDKGLVMNGGVCILDRSTTTVTTTTTAHSLIQVNSGAQLFPSSSRALYNQGGATVGDNTHIIYDINGTGSCQPAASNATFVMADASDDFCVGDVEAGSTGTLDIVGGSVFFQLTNASWNGEASVICAENTGNKKKITNTIIQTIGESSLGDFSIFKSTGANGTDFISTNADFGNIQQSNFANTYYANVDGTGSARDESSNISGIFSELQKSGTTGVVSTSQSFYDSFDFTLTGSVVAPQVINGGNKLVSAGNTGNVANFLVNGHHIMFVVNSVTPTATITVTGTSVSEADGIPTTGDTEVITVDAAGNYQTSKKWMFGATTVSGTINYDIRRLGYEDYSNTDFRLSSWRLEAVSEGPATSLRFRVVGVEDLGSNKMQLNTLEDMTIDNTGITDNLRTAGDDRSATSPVTYWANTTITAKKQIDFNSFFTSGENVFKGSTLDEGYYFEIVSFNKVGVLRFGINVEQI